jgi:hypothetical protein
MNSCSSGPGSYCSFASVYCLSREAAAVQFSLFFVTIGFFIRYREATVSALRLESPRAWVLSFSFVWIHYFSGVRFPLFSLCFIPSGVWAIVGSRVFSRWVFLGGTCSTPQIKVIFSFSLSDI